MLKKKKLVVLLMVICSLSMTSCIGIIEEILFNKDGSGTYSMTLDMSKVANMLNMMGSDNSNELDLGLDSLNTVFDKRSKKIEAVAGISNVRQETDTEKLIFTILFDFEDIDALNRGMSEYFKDEGVGMVEQFEFFTQSKGVIRRTDVNRILDAMDYAMGTDEAGDLDFDPAILLADVYYEQVLTFERKIKSFDNDAYTQSDVNDRILKWKKYIFNPKDESKIGVSVSIR